VPEAHSGQVAADGSVSGPATCGGADRAGADAHRFRTKRQFWNYCGLALETRDSAEYRVIDGQLERKKRPALIRGLNWNYNHELKNVFKGRSQCSQRWPGRISQVLPPTAQEGMRPEMRG